MGLCDQDNSRIFESVDLGVYSVDSQLRITAWNCKMEELSGIGAEIAVGRHLSELFPFLAIEEFAGRIQRVLESGAPEKLRLFTMSAKGKLWLQKRRLTPLMDGERIIGAVVIVEDVTDFKRLLEQTILSEKLAEVGRLSAGIAQEVNNPLAVISFAARLLLREEGTTPFQRDILERIESETERLRTLTASLLSVSRGRKAVKRETDLNVVLREVLRLLRDEMNGHGIRLAEEYGKIPSVQADPGKLKQVFINLLLNASRSMPGGGVLSVRTALASGAEVEAVITDTGGGIPAEVLGQIFEPFSTGKGREGTGLGLYICRNIIAEHGGRLLAESEEGRGAIFRVRLPV